MCLREKIGPDPRNFNQRVSLGRNDLLIRTFLSCIRDFTQYSYLSGVGCHCLSTQHCRCSDHYSYDCLFI